MGLRSRVVTTLGLLVLAGAAAAACGGGMTGGGYGGGGGVGYGGGTAAMITTEATVIPLWVDADEAAKRAQANGTGMVYALEGDKAKASFWDMSTLELSRAVPFVQVAGTEAEAMAKEWKLLKRPAIAVTDRFGNVVWSAPTSLTPNAIKDAVGRVARSEQANAERLAKLYTSAAVDHGKGRIPQALKTLSTVLTYKGYPAVTEAKALHDRIIAQGSSELAAAVSRASDDPRLAKDEMRRVARAYASTSVEDAARAALDTLH
jgi:hypothetical protein